jgi:hypothetical protein
VRFGLRRLAADISLLTLGLAPCLRLPNHRRGLPRSLSESDFDVAEFAKILTANLENYLQCKSPISMPSVEKVIDALKTNCADLHSVVEDLLPAAKAVADEVLWLQGSRKVLV